MGTRALDPTAYARLSKDAHGFSLVVKFCALAATSAGREVFPKSDRLKSEDRMSGPQMGLVQQGRHIHLVKTQSQDWLGK